MKEREKADIRRDFRNLDLGKGIDTRRAVLDAVEVGVETEVFIVNNLFDGSIGNIGSVNEIRKRYLDGNRRNQDYIKTFNAVDSWINQGISRRNKRIDFLTEVFGER